LPAQIFIISNGSLFEAVSAAVHRCKSQLTDTYLKARRNKSCLKAIGKSIS
jgi:hypothetical protein